MRQAFQNDNNLQNLLLDDRFTQKIKASEPAARKAVLYSLSLGIPVGGLVSTVGYFDAFRSGRLPLNLIQAQRDHFGSHTYERLDREGIFHSEW